MRYKLTVSYVGTDFFGFQVQPDKRTVQGVLTQALSAAFDAPVRITGCSRTDAGVHARAFVLLLETEGNNIPPEKIPLAVAPFLPTDVAVTFAERASDTFHARHDVVSKEYEYVIHNAPIASPFDHHRVWQVNRRITDEGFERMREAARHLVGYHDFSAFMAEGSQVRDTHRTVHSLRVLRDGEYVRVFISADGFLYNMVRIIVGTLVAVAFGRIRPDGMDEILTLGARVRAGMTAPPDGLYLNRVSYTDILQ